MGVLRGHEVNEQPVKGQDLRGGHVLQAGLGQFHPGICRKKRGFFLTGGNGHHDSLEQLRGALYQINMAIGDGVEGPRVHHGMGQHEICPPAIYLSLHKSCWLNKRTGLKLYRGDSSR